MKAARNVAISLLCAILAAITLVAHPLVARAKVLIDIGDAWPQKTTAVYTGGDLTDEFILENYFEMLDRGIDYTVAFYNSSNKEVKPIAVGEYRMVAKGINVYTGTATFHVRIIDVYDLGGAINYSSDYDGAFYADGEPHDFRPSLIYLDDTDSYLRIDREYRIDHYERFVSNGTGNAGSWERVDHAIEVGSYRVFVTGIAPYYGSLSVDFEILDAYDLANASIEAESIFSSDDPFALRISISAPYDNALVKETDFVITDVQFVDEDDVIHDVATFGPTSQPGSYRAVVQGIGSYHGTNTATFYLFDGYDLENADYSIDDDVWFSGEPVEPSLDLRVHGKVLKRGTDYTVSYRDENARDAAAPDAPGTWMAVCKPAKTSSYHGQLVIEFYVCSVYDLSYATCDYLRFYMDDEQAGNPARPEIVIYIHGTRVPEDAYKVTYWHSSDDDEDDDEQIGPYESFTIGEWYYAFLEGKAPYQGSCSISFRASASNDLYYADITSDQSRYVLGDDPLTPSIEVRLGDTTLTEGTDYTLSYSMWDDAIGDSVSVSAIKYPGWYYVDAVAVDGSDYIGTTGYTTCGFVVIDSYDLSYAQSDVEYHRQIVCTGEPVELPQFELTLGDTTLREGIDYRVAYVDANDYDISLDYEDLVGPGSYEVVCEGIAPYYGELHVLRLDVYEDDGNLTRGETQLFIEPESYAYIGKPVIPNVAVTYYGKTLVEGVDYTLSYDSGTTAPTSMGEHKVYANGIGHYSGKAVGLFVIGADNDLALVATLDIGGAIQRYTGETIKPAPIVALADGTELDEDVDYTVEYEMYDYAGVAFVDEGTYAVRVNGTGAYTGSLFKVYSILKAEHDLSRAEISGIEEEYLYAGTPIALEYEVLLDGKRLRDDRDYSATLAVKDGERWNNTLSSVRVYEPGHYRLMIDEVYDDSVATYRGVTTVEFDVVAAPEEPPVPAKTDISAATVDLEQDEYEYDGTAHRPSVTVTLDGAILTQLDDYTVTYADNIAVGGATVVVHGTGEYEGEVTAEFAIVEPQEPQTDAYNTLLEELVANIASSEMALGINDARQAVADATSALDDAQATLVDAQDAKDTADAAVAAKEEEIDDAEELKEAAEAELAALQADEQATADEIAAVEATISDLGTQIAQLGDELADLVEQAQQAAQDVATAQSAVTDAESALTTAQENLAALEDDEGYQQLIAAHNQAADLSDVVISGLTDMTYTGYELTPLVTVTKTYDNVDYTLRVSAHYDIAYTDNIEAGTATVTITGKGEEGSATTWGSASATFEIATVSIEDAMVAPIGELPFTGSQIQPQLTIAYQGMPLEQDKDYTLSYGENLDLGDGTVVIVGKGSFTGERTIPFTIAKASLATATVGADPVAYNGKRHKPTPIIVCEGRTLTTDDYRIVSYGSNVNAGEGVGVFVVEGTGNYTGRATGHFDILPVDLSSATVSAEKQTYDGKPKTPDTTVLLDDKTLVEDTDYTVTFDDNTTVGKATIKVTGKGNYTGEATGHFAIETPIVWTRIFGQNALKTMLEIAGEFYRTFGKTDVAILTTKEDFRDALAASALAGRYKAIVLTTAKGSLSAETKTALTTCGVKTVYIVGSTSDVSKNTLNQVKKVKGVTKVKRISGSSPSAKAIALGKELGTAKSKTVIIAMQGASAKKLSFKDALSIAPYSYATKSQILYAEYNKTLSKDTAAYIKKEKFTKAIIVGGPVALPEGIEKQLKSAGIKAANITRLAGFDSYETSEAIARWACGQYKNGTTVGEYNGKPLTSIAFQPEKTMSPDKLGVATSQTWKDALCSAALIGRNGSVLLLADDTGGKHFDNAVSFCGDETKNMSEAYVFGGPLSVSDTVWDELLASASL